MATVPVLPSFSDTVTLTAAQLNQIATVFGFLFQPPICQARQTSAQTLADTVWEAIDMDTADVDQTPVGSTQHSGTHPSRFTAVYAGRYQFSGAVVFDFNATGSRGARWAKNGTAITGAGNLQQAITSTFGNTVDAPVLSIPLAVGDYVELQAFQDRGGNLDTFAAASAASSWTAIRTSN